MRWHLAMLGTLAALLLSPAVGFVLAEETEEQAVAAIEKLGGKVVRDGARPGKPVMLVDLDGTKITDADLIHIKALKTLRWLGLDGTKVSDAGLAHLKDVKHLERLDLDGTKVTDAGLAHLKALRRLRLLIVFRTNVTDAGVKAL